MALEKFIPRSPDAFIRSTQDFEVAKFGHLNTVVEYINSYVTTDSLQLDGTGPLSATARYITDAAGNLSTLAISTTRVGIGTTSPNTNLEIYGGADTLGISGAVNQAKSIQIARYNSSSPFCHYIGDDGGAFFGNGLTISSSGSNSQIYLQIASSGRNVNIGSAGSLTPNIGARLGVRGSGSTSATTSLLVQNSAGSSALTVQDDLTTTLANGVLTGWGANTQLKSLVVNYFSHNRIGSSGALGFDIRSYGNQSSFWNYDDGTGDVNFGQKAVSAGSLRLYTANTERMAISYTGNVGIGNSSPTNRLSVNGKTDFTYVGNSNHDRLFTFYNTDSANNTFGLGIGTYSDGLGNKSLELYGDNTTGKALMGDWVANGWMSVISGLTNNYHDELRIKQNPSNNADTGIVLYNGNNNYQTRFWRDGNVSIADSSYSTSASITSRLQVIGKGSTSATT
mgnify:CR=1 FL=1